MGAMQSLFGGPTNTSENETNEKDWVPPAATTTATEKSKSKTGLLENKDNNPPIEDSIRELEGDVEAMQTQRHKAEQSMQLVRNLAIVIGGALAHHVIKQKLEEKPANKTNPSRLFPRPKYMDGPEVEVFVNIQEFRQRNEYAFRRALENFDHLLEIQRMIEKYPTHVIAAQRTAAQTYAVFCKTNLEELRRSLITVKDKVTLMELMNQVSKYLGEHLALITQATITKATDPEMECMMLSTRAAQLAQSASDTN